MSWNWYTHSKPLANFENSFFNNTTCNTQIIHCYFFYYIWLHMDSFDIYIRKIRLDMIILKTMIFLVVNKPQPSVEKESLAVKDYVSLYPSSILHRNT